MNLKTRVSLFTRCLVARVYDVMRVLEFSFLATLTRGMDGRYIHLVGALHSASNEHIGYKCTERFNDQDEWGPFA
jgi:hypothetical protein